MENLENIDINSVDNAGKLSDVLDNINIDEIIAQGDQNLIKKTFQTYQKYISLLIIEKDQSVTRVNNLSEVLKKIVEQTQIKFKEEKEKVCFLKLYYGNFLYQCFCGKIFQTSRYLKKHFLRRHCYEGTNFFDFKVHKHGKCLSPTRKLQLGEEMVSCSDKATDGSNSQSCLINEADTLKENPGLFTTRTETFNVDSRGENFHLFTKSAFLEELTEHQEISQSSRSLLDRNKTAVIRDHFVGDWEHVSPTSYHNPKVWEHVSPISYHNPEVWEHVSPTSYHTPEDGIIEAGDHPPVLLGHFLEVPELNRQQLLEKPPENVISDWAGLYSSYKTELKSEDEIIHDKKENEDEIIVPSKKAINNVQKNSVKPYKTTKKKIHHNIQKDSLKPYKTTKKEIQHNMQKDSLKPNKTSKTEIQHNIQKDSLNPYKITKNEIQHNIQKDSLNPYEITKKDIQQQFHRELHALGVDPLWKKIPKKSFKKIMKVLNHHQQMSKKVNNEFDTLKKQYSYITVVNKTRTYNRARAIHKLLFDDPEKHDEFPFN